MSKKKSEADTFPHVKGLAKKRTKFGHRWILTEPDFSGVPRSITVKILDTDSVDVFMRKVSEARQALRRRNSCKNFDSYITAFVKMRQLATETENIFRRALEGFSFDEKKNAKLVNEILNSDWKAATKNLKLSKIRTFFDWLNKRGENVKNPALDVVIRNVKSSRNRIFTDDEMNQLIKYVHRCDEEFRLFCLLLIHTGARISTIGELTKNSLDKENRLHLYNVKTKKKYDYCIPITNKETLDLWWKLSKENDKIWTKHYRTHAMRLTVYLHRHFAKDENDEYLSAHSLRHTFASRAIQNGVPLEVVSKLLDHSSLSTTLKVYAKFSQEQIDSALTKIFKEEDK